MLRRSTTIASAGVALALGVGATTAQAEPNPNNSKKFTAAVTTDGVMRHLEAFQAIADANDGNRAAGTSGYEASATYVETQLKKAGYTTERQYFPFIYEVVNETSLTQVTPAPSQDVENTPMSYSPATPDGGVTAATVSPTAATGCTAAEWGNVDATGKIAVVSRGVCSFSQKSIAAGEAGAVAVIIYNNADGALNGTLGGLDDGHIPTTGVTQAEGQRLVGLQGSLTLRFVLDKVVEERETFNVLAETRSGRADNVVMLGAHLDGVQTGPGINDNGTGSAAILETAVQLAKVNKLNNKVRFAWWGAEELGLVGSEYYVQDLVDNDPAELKRIATYLNFDMVGSPNHIIGVYDADQSTYPAPAGVPIPQGSIETEEVFTDYFDSVDQAWVDTEFSGRSDYQAFIANGVPASGLFTGADGSKTAEEVELFGGTAGIPYDPNYHTPQDDIGNVNQEALTIMSKAIAHATITLAQSTESINGKRSAGNSGKPHPTKDGLPRERAAA